MYCYFKMVNEGAFEFAEPTAKYGTSCPILKIRVTTTHYFFFYVSPYCVLF